METRRAMGRALRASIARDNVAERFAAAVSSARSEDLSGIADEAERHGVPGYVARADKMTGGLLPPEVAEDVADAGRAALFAHLVALAELEQIAAAFARAGIRWLIVKGPVLAEMLHGRPELRSYRDVDLLVDPAHLDAALQALGENDGDVLDRNWTLLLREMKGELHVEMPAGTMIDLHWDLFNERSRRDRHSVPFDRLHARSVEMAVGRTKVRTLDPLDTLVYVALHTMASGADRLVWIKDLDLAATAAQPWAGDLPERIEEWGAELIVPCALSRVDAALGPHERSLPTGGERLGDRTWMWICRAAWKASPVEQQHGDASLGRLVARSVRPDAASSLRALAHKSRRAAKGGPRSLDERRLGAAHPSSGFYPSGGEAARRAFLQAVGQGGT